MLKNCSDELIRGTGINNSLQLTKLPLIHTTNDHCVGIIQPDKSVSVKIIAKKRQSLSQADDTSNQNNERQTNKNAKNQDKLSRNNNQQQQQLHIVEPLRSQNKLKQTTRTNRNNRPFRLGGFLLMSKKPCQLDTNKMDAKLEQKQQTHECNLSISLKPTADITNCIDCRNNSIYNNNNNGNIKSKQNKNDNNDKTKPPFPFAGITASIASSFLFSFSTMFVKMLPDSNSFIEKAKVVFFRGLFMGVLCGISIACKRGSPFDVQRNEIWICILRTIFGTLGVFGLYVTISYISIGDAAALVFSSPIWTAILSRIILKEPLHRFNLLALPISIFGIVMITKPELFSPHAKDLLTLPISEKLQMSPLNTSNNNMFSPFATNVSTMPQLTADTNLTSHLFVVDEFGAPTIEASFEDRWIGVLLGVCTSFMVSGAFIVLKFRKTTTVNVTTFWLSVGLMVFSSICMAFFGFPPLPDTREEWLLMAGNGLTS